MSRAGLSERTKAICAMYGDAISKGEHPTDVVGHLSAMFDVQRPAIWKNLRAGGVLPPYSPRTEGGSGRPIGGGVSGYSAARRMKAIDRTAKPFPSQQYVERDPCPRCGARGDFGCPHRTRKLGTAFA